ncbi:gfo/Idh/MocA family oxidoreductase [bacterium]|nr:gfo/Idh/MocA family oxidoreductase [bacterium]
MNKKSNTTRRTFLSQSVAAGTALGMWGANPAWAGANERVRVAVVGIRSHGFGSHIKSYPKIKNVEVAALCDIDENLYPKRLDWFKQNNLPIPKTYYDIRHLLDDKDIDAVSVATPNHWHALAGVWACQAGKHAHVEKPCCHNIFEGQQLIAAGKKYNRIVHHGTESRSSEAYREGIEFMRNGGLGEVYMAKGMCYKWRDSIGTTPNAPVPENVHYNLWLGPAPERPFSKNRFHYNWHWNWDYGNGDIGNQGVHEIDIARWGLGVAKPNRISAVGGHFMFEDDQETPNTLNALFEFDGEDGKKKMLQFEVRHWITNYECDFGQPPNNNIGNIFYGSEGYMVMGNGYYKTYMGRKREPGPSAKGAGYANMSHYQNFIDAIRANDPSILRAPIEEGHETCILIHAANTSYRLGRSLDFDPTTERYIKDEEANGMLTREYREPFVMPKKV